MTNPSPYRLHQSLGYQLSIASRLQERRLEEGLKTLGLTRIAWCVLLAVGSENLVQPSEIADFIGIDRTATSRTLRQMEKDALIVRRPREADRRTTEVILTPKGMELLQTGTPFAQDNNTVMERRLAPGEVLELCRLLTKIRDTDDMALSRL